MKLAAGRRALARGVRGVLRSGLHPGPGALGDVQDPDVVLARGRGERGALVAQDPGFGARHVRLPAPAAAASV